MVSPVWAGAGDLRLVLGEETGEGFSLHSNFPKYRGKNTSCYLSPSPQHGAQQKLVTSSAVVEAVESFTFLWHFDTVENY